MPTPPSRQEEPPLSAPLAEMGSRALQLCAPSFSAPDSSCSMHVQAAVFGDPQQQQQFGDVMLPSNGYSFSPRGGMDYSSPMASLPTSSPLPWNHALSSDVDYYGQGMAAYSSSESLTLCNPLDPNSYSPQDSFSSSSSSCYDSPTRMESSFHSFPLENYSYQQCGSHQDFMPGCWPAQQESIPVPEYTPYYTPTDYPYIPPVEESYARKDFSLGSEMCYNVL
ncbi:PREDICTED: colorectal cancer-associated protein 2 isoform X2 [Cyprinodon variegatus]|nr:PREDICTED: colorectal cancer-associated protein 2 isoform X2 [Cyprinodon variegatus]XP_015228430.1 PREDICTED: colorectal cancer-associated protein 2 isoform X2 [Cyprinodon variegatus]